MENNNAEKFSENNVLETAIDKDVKKQIKLNKETSLIAIFSILGIILLFLSFYKWNFYNNPESSYLKHVNAYVGGDAYNYIINAVLSTGYLISGILCEFIAIYIDYKRKEIK